jgi:putative transposase
MLSVRHPLSLRNGEALLHERGIEIRYETVRFWWDRLGLSSSAKEGQKAKENLS